LKSKPASNVLTVVVDEAVGIVVGIVVETGAVVVDAGLLEVDVKMVLLPPSTPTTRPPSLP